MWRDEVDFLTADKLFSTSYYHVFLARYAQITKNNKFAISLQYLKKEASDAVDFLHANKHEIFFSFSWRWSSISKVS